VEGLTDGACVVLTELSKDPDAFQKVLDDTNYWLKQR